MKYTIVFSVLLLIAGCDSDSKDEKITKTNVWAKLDNYSGASSVIYTSKVVGDKLFLQSAYEVSTIKTTNQVTHYTEHNFSDSNSLAAAIGESFFATTIDNGGGVLILSSTNLEQDLDDFGKLDRERKTIYFRSAELFSSQLLITEEIKVITPLLTPGGGPSPFGIFNNSGSFITIVYVPDTRTCFAIIIGQISDERIDNKEMEIKTVTEMPFSTCDRGPSSLSLYATNGLDYFVGTLDNNLYKISLSGEVTEIYNGNIWNVIYRSDGALLVQDSSELYMSTDDGENWELILENALFFRSNIFEINEKLYYFVENRIFDLGINSSDTQAKEIENSGLEDISSHITSISEFEGKIYITTLGDGVFYTQSGQFELNKE